jgi:hypothetical protein
MQYIESGSLGNLPESRQLITKTGKIAASGKSPLSFLMIAGLLDIVFLILAFRQPTTTMEYVRSFHLKPVYAAILFLLPSLPVLIWKCFLGQARSKAFVVSGMLLGITVTTSGWLLRAGILSSYIANLWGYGDYSVYDAVSLIAFSHYTPFYVGSLAGVFFATSLWIKSRKPAI